jgi:hypothetical protein
VDGVARTSYEITGAANLEIRAESEPATTSQILVLNITEGAGAEITAIVPTSQPTDTPIPTVTPQPSPTITPTIVVAVTPSGRIGDWFLSLVVIWGSSLGIVWVGRRRISLRWGVRWGLLAVTAGLLAYTLLALGWFGSRNWFGHSGTAGLIAGSFVGVLIGWLAGWIWQSRLKNSQ